MSGCHWSNDFREDGGLKRAKKKGLGEKVKLDKKGGQW